MNSTPDTYCGLVRGVVCEACPLAELSEITWKQAVNRGVTPFDAAHDVGRAVLQVCDELQDTGPYEESFEGLPDEYDELEEATPETLQYEKTSDEDGDGLEEIVEQIADDMVGDLQIVTLKRSLEIMNAVDDDKAPPKNVRSPVRVIRALGKCVERQATGACGIDQTIEQASDTLSSMPVDRGMGANMLEIMARHSSDGVEVRQLCQRVHEVLEDAKARFGLPEHLIDFGALSEAECRAYLLIEAERLRSGVYHF